MSLLSQFLSGGGKLRYQEFLTSGTFTPPAELLANGGQCWVRIVGGSSGAMTLDDYNAAATLEYSGATKGWI